MPIYEYECKACGHRQEAIQKMSDDPLVGCPVCNKPELKKLISAAAFRLKGGGWYETDFKGGNKKNVAGNESAGKSADNTGKSADNTGKSADNNNSSSSTVKPKSAGGCGSGGCGCH